MRAVRRSLADRSERSARLWAVVQDLPAVGAATTVMAYRSVAGEPDSSAFIDWCVAHGKTVLTPEPSKTAAAPVAPRTIDVAVVPGLAFAADGRRLGQGGGWYDRVLSQLRTDAVTVGVCFEPQLVDDLPTEPHDIVLDVVVTDAGAASGSGERSEP